MNNKWPMEQQQLETLFEQGRITNRSWNGIRGLRSCGWRMSLTNERCCLILSGGSFYHSIRKAVETPKLFEQKNLFLVTTVSEKNMKVWNRKNVISYSYISRLPTTVNNYEKTEKPIIAINVNGRLEKSDDKYIIDFVFPTEKNVPQFVLDPEFLNGFVRIRNKTVVGRYGVKRLFNEESRILSLEIIREMLFVVFKQDCNSKCNTDAYSCGNGHCTVACFFTGFCGCGSCGDPCPTTCSGYQ